MNTSQDNKKRTIGAYGLYAIAITGCCPLFFTLPVGIAAQGTSTLFLFVLGVLLSAMAVPGYIELALMYPNKNGGIAAVLTDAFRPYSPVIGCLAGTFYWWGWFEGSSFAATLEATIINQLWPTLPFSVPTMATSIIVLFTFINFLGMKWVSRMVIPFSAISILLAILGAFVPIFSGHVDWSQVYNLQLKTTFGGAFGQFTSLMAGLYFIAYSIPASETTLAYIAETKDPARVAPRAMYFGAILTALFYILLPSVWLGTIGAKVLTDAVLPLDPTYAPLFGRLENVATILFLMSNAIIPCFVALTNCPRTLAQLADDGLMPRFFGWSTKAN